APAHPRGGPPARGRRPDVRLRPGAGLRDHHAVRGGFGRCQAAALGDHRKVHRVRGQPVMKFLLVIAATLVLAIPAAAQRAPLSRPIDPDLERADTHYIDVGRQYVKRKAWAGAKGRFEEIVASYEDFTKIDEVYYL